jgi:RNA polymerase sigma factor (sigma-70 family)
LVIDRGRKLGQEINIDEATWHEVEPAAQTVLPLDQIAAGETSDELSAALGQLTQSQRRVLLLRYFSDLTFEEIAGTLGCPLSTALSHCRRGLAAMRKLMTTTEP